MKTRLSKQEAQQEIIGFFKRESFTSIELRKIKRLAMKFKIKLKDYRKEFCKKCLSQSKGKVIISKKYKTIICKNCNFRNKFRIN